MTTLPLLPLRAPSLLAPIAGLGAVLLVDILTRPLDPVLRMTAVVICGLAVVKILVLLRTRPQLTQGAAVAFALWPGMDPTPFEHPRPIPQAQVLARVRDAFGWLLLGGCLVAVLHLGAAALPPMLVGLVALVAASLVLHFGLLGLVTALLWHRGHPVQPLFDRPLLAHSLSEFWGRRWNRAFSDMLRILLVRPLRGRLPRPVLVALGFFLSGVLHEAALSLPVLDGWGGPLVYFALHAGLVLFEQHRKPDWLQGPLGRLWTLTWLVAPLPLLFHPPFIGRVLLPLLGLEPL